MRHDTRRLSGTGYSASLCGHGSIVRYIKIIDEEILCTWTSFPRDRSNIGQRIYLRLSICVVNMNTCKHMQYVWHEITYVR